jgi:site-specific DNA-cytosine methylase
VDIISCFAGIEGFGYGAERAGFRVVAQIENDPKCRRVLRHHYPDALLLGDIREVDPAELPHADVVCGGFPCQDLSVAGRRAGLAGERSGLFFEFMRLVADIRPDWVVIENVPGLLSSNGGRDMAVVLDSLEDLGYILDCDILDAQNFGVAQRRRRVFLVCQHVESLLSQRTTSSAQTIAQCLVEILLSILVEARRQSPIAPIGLGLESKFSADGLRRRIKLFGIAQEERWPTLLENLGAERLRFPNEPELLAWVPGEGGTATNQTRMGARCESMCGTATGKWLDEWNTERSWRSILGAVSTVARSFTTLTATSSITESAIYSFAQMLLSINTFIGLSSESSPAFWNAALSASIAYQEVTSYARQSSSNLFAGLDWICAWGDLLQQTLQLRESFAGSRSRTAAAKVLFEPESCAGDSPPSRSAGAGVAGGVNHCFKSSGGFKGDTTHETYLPEVCGSLTGGNGARGWKMNAENAENAADGQLVVAIEPAVFNWQTGGKGFLGYGDKPTALSTNQTPAVLEPRAVRRLTPTECLRLQGFPDDWLDLDPPLADGPKYRMTGNAVATVCSRWIFERIKATTAR